MSGILCICIELQILILHVHFLLYKPHMLVIIELYSRNITYLHNMQITNLHMDFLSSKCLIKLLDNWTITYLHSTAGCNSICVPPTFQAIHVSDAIAIPPSIFLPGMCTSCITTCFALRILHFPKFKSFFYWHTSIFEKKCKLSSRFMG